MCRIDPAPSNVLVFTSMCSHCYIHPYKNSTIQLAAAKLLSFQTRVLIKTQTFYCYCLSVWFRSPVFLCFHAFSHAPVTAFNLTLQAAVNSFRVAELGEERSVMDEDSDLEQIKSCQKLLNHQTWFWLRDSDTFMERVYYTCCGVIFPAVNFSCFPKQQLSRSGRASVSLSVKYQDQNASSALWMFRHKIQPVIRWVPCQKWKCQQKLSSIYLMSTVHFQPCMKSAEVWVWFIVMGSSVLHGIIFITTDFTSRRPVSSTRATCGGF